MNNDELFEIDAIEEDLNNSEEEYLLMIQEMEKRKNVELNKKIKQEAFIEKLKLKEEFDYEKELPF